MLKVGPRAARALCPDLVPTHFCLTPAPRHQPLLALLVMPLHIMVCIDVWSAALVDTPDHR